MSLRIVRSIKETIRKAKEAEADGDPERAAELYEQVIKDGHADEFPFDRLMVIYRKMKRYKDELGVINTGIKSFENHFSKKKGKASPKKTQLTKLSNAFMKTAGLTDKKGNNIYYPEPIATWRKRKEVVEGKMKK
jgi:hypothetical protein